MRKNFFWKRMRRSIAAAALALAMAGVLAGCGNGGVENAADAGALQAAAWDAASALPSVGNAGNELSGPQGETSNEQNQASGLQEKTSDEQAETPVPRKSTGQECDLLEVHFIDVGQGDATLIKCGDSAMLIDAAESDKGTAVQSYLKKQGVEKLDYLILTHPDADHIGGAPVIITKFEIGKVLMSNFEKDNATYRKLIQALDNKGLKPYIPQPVEEPDRDGTTGANASSAAAASFHTGVSAQAGDSYPEGSLFTMGSAVCTVLGPFREYDNPNDSSVAILIQNGNTRFLFTGDAEENAEQDILAAFPDIRADVYKAGHHGSRTASCEALLDTVQPRWAVISCEEGNSYGHPHAQTLNNLRVRGIEVYRTDEQGSLIASSDGTKITWNAAPSETWKAGEPTGSGESGQQTGGSEGKSIANQSGAKQDNAVQGHTDQSGAGQSSAGQGSTAQDSAAQGSVGVGEQKEDIVRDTGQTLAESAPSDAESPQSAAYVLNTKTKKFHKLSCSYLPTVNRKDTVKSREEILAEGYEPCKKCNP